jgi:HAMP domain-containing protein
VHEAVDTVFHLALIGIPLLVLITGIVTYLAAGRALRPVEAIRARVATTRDPSVRVPVPPARDEVGRLAETMNEMLARLQAGQAVQRRFVADASHELRSPFGDDRDRPGVAGARQLRTGRRPRHDHRPARGDRAAGSAGRRAAAARPRRRERPAAAVRGRRPR